MAASSMGDHPGGTATGGSDTLDRSSPSGSRDLNIPVEDLVEHLLAAKRSLSSVKHIFHVNNLANEAQHSHEEAAVLRNQVAFLLQAIWKQTHVLLRVRRGLKRTYDAGKREFALILKAMDTADEKLQGTIGMLRSTPVESVFRPEGEEPKNLMDFVDEQSVHGMVEALKKSLSELQSVLVSFDGDLLRFDDDLRALKKSMTQLPEADKPMPDLLLSLAEQSHSMAQLLTSLTNHFDLCVTAVRNTEGGADLARQRAAESGVQGGETVSISGVITDQESRVDLEPTTSKDRADMLEIVVNDASQVGDVMHEISEHLDMAIADHNALTEQAEQIRATHAAARSTLRILEDIGSRLADYLSAEAEFIQRWDDEKYTIHSQLGEMDDLRDFYERYAGAYDSLLVEVDRRRAAEDRIRTIWRKARESVDKVIEVDQRERESFRQDVGEFIPTDLWHGMSGEMKKWELVPAGSGNGNDEAQQQHSTPSLDRRVVEAARNRLDLR